MDYVEDPGKIEKKSKRHKGVLRYSHINIDHQISQTFTYNGPMYL
jgi:hypothetical protein